MVRTTSKRVISINAKLGINEGGELWLPEISVTSMPRLGYPVGAGGLGDITVVIDVAPPDAPRRYGRLEAEALERRWRKKPEVRLHQSFKLRAILLKNYEFSNSEILGLHVRDSVGYLIGLQIMEAKIGLQNQGIAMQNQWRDIMRGAFIGDRRSIPQLRKG